MVEIQFEIKGQKIEPAELKDVLDVMFLEYLQEKIRNSLNSLQCKKHGREPVVKIKGQSLDNLTYEVSGCCPEFIEETQQKIK